MPPILNTISIMALHYFQSALALEFGIEGAILIDEFQHQISWNTANEKNFHEGRYWTFNSMKAYEKKYPYLNSSKIKRTINSLIQKGILVKGNFNTNQYDRTNWYAFTDMGLSIVQNCYIDELKMTNGRVKNGRPIPTTNTTNTTIYFSPSSKAEDGDLFDEGASSTLTMLSSESKLPYAPDESGATKFMRDECFEDLWLLYERKGSKANAKKEFAKLTEDEIATMRKHIPAYLESRPERQYRQDFERYIKHKTFNSVVYSKQNTVLYDPEANNTSASCDTPQEFSQGTETIAINGNIYR